MTFTEKSKEIFEQLIKENKKEIENLMDIVISENKEALEKLAKLWDFLSLSNAILYEDC